MTIDEGIIMYKGMYCPIRQYMPRKPVRFGLKVWVAADTLSKYLWNFEVYCEKSENPHDNNNMHCGSGSDSSFDGEEQCNKPRRGEGFTCRNVAKNLIKDLKSWLHSHN
jgi:hypothetical protein